MDADCKQEGCVKQTTVVSQTETCKVIDCGIEGRAMITGYDLFDGIRLYFYDIDTADVIAGPSNHPDIVQITYCREGRYECEFPDRKVSYLPKGAFGVASGDYLPVSFSFPLKRCEAVSIVIDKQKLSESTRKVFAAVPIDPDRVGDNLGIEGRWYVKQAPRKIEKLFYELYEGKGCERIGYFKIKTVELLYQLEQMHQLKGCDFKYFDREQVNAVKEIILHLEKHLDEKKTLESLVKQSSLSLSVFHHIFGNVYGETPYAYLKKYKMELAADRIMEGDKKIGEVALEVGYSNASKFAKAFESVYGMLPKDYRKQKKESSGF